jgi:hypothetical protein
VALAMTLALTPEPRVEEEVTTASVPEPKVAEEVTTASPSSLVGQHGPRIRRTRRPFLLVSGYVFIV